MSEENKCAFCDQQLPHEDKIVHTNYGKTCSWICSNALVNEKSLKNDIEKLKEKTDNIAQYLTNMIRRELNCNRIKIDFDK